MIAIFSSFSIKNTSLKYISAKSSIRQVHSPLGLDPETEKRA
jgi:hypothetical protein